ALSRQRGFALIIVLWAVGLLALLAGQFIATGRSEIQIAANLRDSEAVQNAADGAVHEAILHLLQGAWQPDGAAHTLRVAGAVIEVHVHNQSGKLNPNVASAAALRSMLIRIGSEARQAEALAAAIVEWRSATPRSQSGKVALARYAAAGLPYGPPGQPFDSLDELGLVMGMTPVLLARIKPLFSVYQEGDIAEPDELPGTARNGAATSAWVLGATGRVMVVLIEAAGIGPSGARFAREAIVRLRAEASLEQAPYQ